MNWIEPTKNRYSRIETRRAGVDQMNGNAVMYDKGKILALGGAANYYYGASGTRSAYIIDANDGDNVSVSRTGFLVKGRTYCTSVVLPSGEVVVIGGRDNAIIFADGPQSILEAEIWSPKTGRFTLLNKMRVPRNYHSVAILMRDGRVFVGGGGLCPKCTEDGTNHPDAEIFTPPYLLDGNGRQKKRPKVAGISWRRPQLGSRITVAVDTPGWHTFSVVRKSAVTHSVNNDMRRIPLDARKVGFGGIARWSLEIPSNPNVMLNGGYWLFAINSEGVPSIGQNIWF